VELSSLSSLQFVEKLSEEFDSFFDVLRDGLVVLGETGNADHVGDGDGH